MLSDSDRNTLIDLAHVYRVDQDKQRGGEAAGRKRKSLHLKLLSLWVKALVNLCSFLFDLPPHQVPGVAPKYERVRSRLEHLQTPGVKVYKGTPLLGHPVVNVDDSDSEDSVLES